MRPLMRSCWRASPRCVSMCLLSCSANSPRIALTGGCQSHDRRESLLSAHRTKSANQPTRIHRMSGASKVFVIKLGGSFLLAGGAPNTSAIMGMAATVKTIAKDLGHRLVVVVGGGIVARQLRSVLRGC